MAPAVRLDPAEGGARASLHRCRVEQRRAAGAGEGGEPPCRPRAPRWFRGAQPLCVGAQAVWVPLVPLADVLEEFSLVNYLDIDIQGSESFVILAARKKLQNVVRALHIGTHSLGIHQQLREMLLEDGWQLRFDYPPNSSILTEFGWVSVRDGVISARNPWV